MSVAVVALSLAILPLYVLLLYRFLLSSCVCQLLLKFMMTMMSLDMCGYSDALTNNSRKIHAG